METQAAARPKRIGDMLVEAGLITTGQLETALALHRQENKKIGQVLVEKGFISATTLATFVSHQLNLPLIDLTKYKIQPAAVRLVPEETARRYNLLPVAIDGGDLLVAMEDPLALRVIEEISARTRLRLKPMLATAAEIQEAIGLHYKATGEIEQQVKQIAPMAPVREEAEARLTAQLLAQAPVVRTVDLLVSQAVKDRASDIHIEPQEDHLHIRYRIDGILHEMMTLPLSAHAPLLSRIKILADMNIAERRRPQDGQFSVTVDDKEIDIRAATAESVWGEMATLRVLDKSLSALALPELGFLPDVQRVYEQVLKTPYGMVLISGPTGSGKTTTLYASVNRLDRQARNVMTIEDPIEYRFGDINQIQVNPLADITFATGLRAIMRLDPDVILVGEIRDTETARTAVHAALTGHLVFSSVHANDAVGALFRLLDLGIEPFLITSALVAVAAQRLVRRVCPHCRALAPAPEEEAVAYESEMGERRSEFYYGAGCNFCAYTGFLGRTGVFEVLVMTEELRCSLLAKNSAGEIKAQAIRQGMVPMRRHGMLKARAGITTPGEVLRNVFVLR
ncbi:MAG: type II/IV secretion system protein [Chloroflexi bacterium]|nr:type II/IV secretion system protein [Chloroflexota bacterium]